MGKVPYALFFAIYNVLVGPHTNYVTALSAYELCSYSVIFSVRVGPHTNSRLGKG
jgi:hypothetical protein